MGIGCQRDRHWAATNHLSGRGLMQPFKELSSAAGRCARRGCALINQLANNMSRNKITQSDSETHSFVIVVLR